MQLDIYAFDAATLRLARDISDTRKPENQSAVPKRYATVARAQGVSARVSGVVGPDGFANEESANSAKGADGFALPRL